VATLGSCFVFWTGLGWQKKRNTFSERSPCLQDRFTRDFLGTYRGEALTSAEAMASLTAVVSSVKMVIAHVEVGHGRLRRRVLAASHSTNAHHFQKAGTEWVFSEVRRRRRDAERMRGQSFFSNRKPKGQAQRDDQQDGVGRSGDTHGNEGALGL